MSYAIERENDITSITAEGVKEKEAFLDAARGLFASIYDFEKIHGRDERVKIVVEEKSLVGLLRVWLQELLERRTIHEIIYGSFSIVSIQKINNTQYLLTGSASGEAFDSTKHPTFDNPVLQSKGMACSEGDKNFSCTFQIKSAK